MCETPGPRQLPPRQQEHSPLSSREFLGSIQVQLSYFFGCLNYTIGILDVYQPFHAFALLLRFKKKRKGKKLCPAIPQITLHQNTSNTLHHTPKVEFKVVSPPDSKTICEPGFVTTKHLRCSLKMILPLHFT